jgi:hypothetical protein
MVVEPKDLHRILGSEYNPTQDDWVREYARHIVCGFATDSKDAQFLLEAIGLLNDSGVSTSNSTNELSEGPA